MNNLICDPDGVPRLIQRMRYLRSDMTIEVKFFNGKVKIFLEEEVGNCLDLMQHEPTTMQWLQIENAVNILALMDWGKWFPHLRSVGGTG